MSNPLFNPEQIINQALSNNPQLRQKLQFMQQEAQSKGLTSEQYAKQWFQNNAISQNQIQDIVNRFGVRL